MGGATWVCIQCDVLYLVVVLQLTRITTTHLAHACKVQVNGEEGALVNVNPG